MKEYKYNTVSEVLDEIAEKINSKEILTQDWLEEIISEVSVIDNEGVFGKKQFLIFIQVVQYILWLLLMKYLQRNRRWNSIPGT